LNGYKNMIARNDRKKMAAWTLRLLDGTSSIKCTILCYGCREQTREKKIKLIYTYTYMLT